VSSSRPTKYSGQLLVAYAEGQSLTQLAFMNSGIFWIGATL
jgi:hypothetical protein